MPKAMKKCAFCAQPFAATCGSARYCSDQCHLVGSIAFVGECWEWTAGLDKDGYGVVKLRGGRRGKAHRASYQTFRGAIGPGMMVCHRCDNPRCVRPDHLFLGDAKANKADCITKGRHAHGERHHKAKLSEDDVRAIRKDARRNVDIAADYNVTKEMIGLIRNRKSWKHVPIQTD